MSDNKVYTLPPPPYGNDIYQVEIERAIEDTLKQRADNFEGNIVPGATVGGNAAGSVFPMDVINGGLESRGFVAGSAGWRIRGDGSVEFAQGVFRGDVRQNAITAKLTRTANVNNLSAGSYFINGLNADYNIGNGIDIINVSGSAAALSPKRTGIYLCAGYVVISTDASPASVQAALRVGTTVSATGGTDMQGMALSNQAVSTLAFPMCIPIRFSSTATRLWISVSSGVQFDLLTTDLAMHYLSEL